MKKVFLAIVLTNIFNFLLAQGKFDINMDLETMHYWRGYRVYSGMGTGTTLGYYIDGFAIKVWGGLSIDGKYQEVTPIISYAKNGFSITFSDIDNFSNAVGKAAEYGNYDRKTTNHIMDLAVGYDFSNVGLPLNITWATIVHGGGDFNPDADLTQRYSTYVELSSTFKTENKVDVMPFIGFAFALNEKDNNVGNFYTPKDGVSLVNVGVQMSKVFTLQGINFPITTKFAVNPANKQATVHASWAVF